MKKHQHPRTEEDGGDDQNNTEFSRNKKVKKSSPETEAGSFSLDHSCFVALVTAANLQNDTLDLPKDFISSNGLKRICRKIVLTDGGERSWALDLSFNKSSDIFYISRGWRNFCDENGQEAGGFFMFKPVGNGNTPVLSFCPTDSTNDGTTGDNNNRECCIELDRNKNGLSQNRFVTLTLTLDSFKNLRLHLPLPFMRENGLDKPGMITLLGKDGTKWLANRIRECSGRMSLGKGWKEFAIANGLEIGESFTLESIWQDKTPMLSLFCTDSSNDRRQQGEYSSKASEKEPVYTDPNSGNKTRKAKRNREETSSKDLLYRRASLSPKGNRFVTLTPTHDSVRKGRLGLPFPFTRKHGLDKPRLITLLGKDGTEWVANLRQESKGGIMKLGKGWKDFAIGESFTLESIWKDATPMLRLFSEESPSDRRQQGEHCSKDSETDSIPTEPNVEDKTRKANNNSEEKTDPSSVIQNPFVTLTLTPEDVKDCKLILPSHFFKAIGIKKLGKIILLGKDRMKYLAFLLSRDGLMDLGTDWEGFCEANGVK